MEAIPSNRPVPPAWWTTTFVLRHAHHIRQAPHLRSLGYVAYSTTAVRTTATAIRSDLYLVDHRGTHRLDAEQGAMLLDAPPGLDLYVADLTYEPPDPSGAARGT